MKVEGVAATCGWVASADAIYIYTLYLYNVPECISYENAPSQTDRTI
jgi:hypothetical protein